MQNDIDLTSAINMAARLIAANLRRQAPVATGALKRSIRVSGSYTGDSIQFRYSYLYYGKFVDKGTGPYGVRGKGKTGQWNPNPGKGIGGIRPRFWTSLEDSVKKQVKKQVAKAIGQYIRTQFRKKVI